MSTDIQPAPRGMYREAQRQFPILAAKLDCRPTRKDDDGQWFEVGPHGDGGYRRQLAARVPEAEPRQIREAGTGSVTREATRWVARTPRVDGGNPKTLGRFDTKAEAEARLDGWLEDRNRSARSAKRRKGTGSVRLNGSKTSWVAVSPQVKGERLHLGSFATYEAAEEALEKWLKENSK